MEDETPRRRRKMNDILPIINKSACRGIVLESGDVQGKSGALRPDRSGAFGMVDLLGCCELRQDGKQVARLWACTIDPRMTIDGGEEISSNVCGFSRAEEEVAPWLEAIVEDQQTWAWRLLSR